MSLTHEQIQALKDRYGDDERAIIESDSSLDVLYAFGNLRESLIEWYDMERGARAYLASECPALERCLTGKGLTVDVAGCGDPDPGNVYDYLFFIGDIDLYSDEEYEELFGRLRTGGKVFIAWDNRYGIKYLNGAKPRGAVYSLRELLSRTGGSRYGDELYYPMPDYRLPTSIYSDDYLPKEGELSRAAAAYDDAEYTAADLGSRYDEICRDGRFRDFANSYLLIRTR